EATVKRHSQRPAWCRAALVLVLAAAVASTFAACTSSKQSSSTGTSGSKPISDVSLRLDFSWVADHTAFLMAQAKGYYKDAGLNVDIEQGQGSATTMAVVGSGRDDFGWGDLSTAALSISKGVPLVTVAVVTRHTPFGTECYKNVPFHSPK